MDYQRKYYIDILRGIGMLLVVYGHIIRIYPDRSYIWTFHMPLFFFISGLTFIPNKYNSLKVFIIRRGIFLLIPYLIFYLLCLPLWAAFTLLYKGDLSIADFLKEFLLMFYGNMTASGGALWFLPCLFMAEIIYWNINTYSSRSLQLLISLLLMIIGYLIINFNIKLPFGLNIALLVMPFYSIAYLSKESIERWKESNIILKIIPFVLLFILQLYLFKFSGLDLALYYIENIFAYIPMALSAIIFYLIISLTIRKCSIIEWIGKNTLVILAFHGYAYKIILWGISLFTSKSFDSIRANYIICIATTVLTILFLVPIIKLYNTKIIPLLNQLYNRVIK